MNALLLRFALFLTTSVGITVLAMAGPDAGAGIDEATARRSEAACVLDGLAVVAADAMEAREHGVGHRQRPARWQTLLPGAFL
jgi:hypothetical protein